MARRTPRKRRKKKSKQQAIPEYSEPIPCSFLARSQYAGILPNYEPDLLRQGTYHSSMFFDVEQFGVKRWVVGTYIDVDYEAYLEQGLTIEEVLAGCIIFLNQPPPRKKYQRRLKNPLYGNLDPMPYRHGLKEIDGKKYIWALLVTDKRKCRYFWSEGPKV